MTDEQSTFDLCFDEVANHITKHGGPPKTGMAVPCANCGALTYRKKSRLKAYATSGQHPSSGLCYCSRKCKSGASVKLSLICATCGVFFQRYPSLTTRSKNLFCSKSCSNSYGLLKVTCNWPGCTETMDCRVTVGVDRKGRILTEYKTNLVKKGDYTKSVLCPGHLTKLKSYLGDEARLSNARIRTISDPNSTYGHRVVSNRFFRALVFDRADGKCQCCAVPQDFNAPPKVWQIDHIIPVFRGGVTSLGNSQLLCESCHDAKSSLEKGEAGRLRHAGNRVNRWLTHHQKDVLIADLRSRIERLEFELRQCTSKAIEKCQTLAIPMLGHEPKSSPEMSLFPQLTMVEQKVSG